MTRFVRVVPSLRFTLAVLVLSTASPAAAQTSGQVYAALAGRFDWSRPTTMRDRSCDPAPQLGLFGCGTGEDGAGHVVVLVHVLVAEDEPGEHGRGERILLLGPVHREDHDRSVALDRAVLGTDVEGLGHGRGA